MKAQFKKKGSNEVSANSENIHNVSRPNIDHLVKRIMTERRREKKKSVIMMSIALVSFALMSFFFTKT